MSEAMDQLVNNLGNSYHEWKAWSKEKEADRLTFFHLADEELIKQGLMEKVVTYPGTPEKARERVERHNPGWKVVEARPIPEQEAHQFVLIEDPSLKPYSYEHQGVKYSRQIRRGAIMVDEEWLQEDDPLLWEAITYQLPWDTRVVMPVEFIPEAMLTKLTKYIYNDKPKATLAAPSAVTE